MKIITSQALVLMVAWCSLTWAGEAEDGEQFDPRADEVLHAVADYYSHLKNFSVDIAFKLTLTATGMRREMWSQYEVVIQRPNRVAFRLKDGVGASLISDGKQLYTFVPAMKKYTQTDAPHSLDELSLSHGVALISRSMGNMLFLDHLLKRRPYDSLRQQLSRLEYVGLDRIEGTACHRILFTQHGIPWELWVRRGPEPMILKIAPELDEAMAEAAESMPQIKDARIEIVLRFERWRTNEELSGAEFVFAPPAGTQRVISLFEADERSELIGRYAPAVSLLGMDGGQIDLEEHREQIVVLDFWATWCPPCLKSMPVMAEIAEKYKDKGVVFYAVNQDEDMETVRSFLKRRRFDIPVAIDRGGVVAGLYGFSAIPQTIIIGRDGRIEAVHEGLLPDLKATLTHELDQLVAGESLARQAPAPRRMPRQWPAGSSRAR